MTEGRLTVTAQNIDALREEFAGDIAEALEVGQTIEVSRHTPNQGGHTVIFDGDRVAIFQGADSTWGDLDSDRNVRLDTGELLTLDGDLIEE